MSDQRKMPLSVSVKVTRALIWGLLRVLDVLYFPLYVRRKFEKPRRCEPIKDPLLLLSAASIASKIRHGEISCVGLIKSYIRRIEHVNPVINAVVDKRFGDALQEAEAVDKLIAAGVKPEELERDRPLLGVPLTVKESIAVKGLSNRAGCKPANCPLAPEDAVVVKYAREAGAIPLLVSNTPELCMCWDTDNKITGRTLNPYDTTKSPGGSSGGEASLLASAASVIGLGSDIGGSLRLPAHFCGVWGHKPSPGVVSSKGHYPDCSDEEGWRNYFTLGPMARYAQDLPLLLKCIVSRETRELLRLDDEVDLRHVNVYYVDSYSSFLVSRMRPEISESVRKVVGHFEKEFGRSPKKIDIKNLEYVGEFSFAILAQLKGIDYISETNLGVWKEGFKYLIRRSDSMGFTILYGLIRQFTFLFSKKTKRLIVQTMADIKANLVNALGCNGVLLFPAFTSAAFNHGDVARRVFDTGYSAMWNVFGLPVSNCPVGFRDNGLPVGVQVVAAPNCDRLSLAVAREIERAFGGWKPPQDATSN